MNDRKNIAKPRPYIINENNWKSIKETEYTIAILPWGATEAHNYHLPYGTDNIQCDYIAAEAARRAWERDVKVAVLPTIPYGVNTQQLDIPLTINMNPSTQAFVLRDIVDSLFGHGIAKDGSEINDIVQLGVYIFNEMELDTPSGEVVGIGKKGKDNGVLVLVAMQDREWRIEVGEFHHVYKE